MVEIEQRTTFVPAATGWRAVYVTEDPPLWCGIPIIGWHVMEQVENVDGGVRTVGRVTLVPLIWGADVAGVVDATTRPWFWTVLGPAQGNPKEEDASRALESFKAADRARQATEAVPEYANLNKCPTCGWSSHPLIAPCPDLFHYVVVT